MQMKSFVQLTLIGAFVFFPHYTYVYTYDGRIQGG